MKNTEKIFKKLRKDLREDILERYDNSEYWSKDIYEICEQKYPKINFSNFFNLKEDTTINITVKGGIVINVENLPKDYDYKIIDLDINY